MGSKPQMLLNADATAEAVRAHLDAAAAELGEGDFFFLTYSGHGGQVPDENQRRTRPPPTKPGASTTPSWSTAWFGALCTFAAGVRVFVHVRQLSQRNRDPGRSSADATSAARRAIRAPGTEL